MSGYVRLDDIKDELTDRLREEGFHPLEPKDREFARFWKDPSPINFRVGIEEAPESDGYEGCNSIFFRWDYTTPDLGELANLDLLNPDGILVQAANRHTGIGHLQGYAGPAVPFEIYYLALQEETPSQAVDAIGTTISFLNEYIEMTTRRLAKRN